VLAAGVWFSRVEGSAVRWQAQQEFQAVATITVGQIAARYLSPLVQTWPTPSSAAETLLVRLLRCPLFGRTMSPGSRRLP
jgi:hypothetical protein